MERAPPSQSTGVDLSSRDSITRSWLTTRLATAIPAPRKKGLSQPKRSSSAPPATSPNSMPTPAMPAQMATARVLSSGVNTTLITDRVVGITIAPPMPMNARTTMSSAPVEAKSAAYSELTTNSPRPICMRSFRR